jgi:hypothetical protein
LLGTSAVSLALAAPRMAITLHLLHSKHLQVADQLGMLFIGLAQELRVTRVCRSSTMGVAPAFRTHHEFNREFVRHVDIEQDALAFLERSRILHQQFRQFRISWIDHS